MNYVQLYVIEGNTHSQVELFDFEGIELVQQIQDVKTYQPYFLTLRKAFLFLLPIKTILYSNTSIIQM